MPVPGIDVDLRDGEEVLHDLKAALHGADVEYRGPRHPVGDQGRIAFFIIIDILTITITSGRPLLFYAIKSIPVCMNLFGCLPAKRTTWMSHCN